MYIQLDIQTDFEVKSLIDIAKIKLLMENLKIKINDSQLARELGGDRRTIDKYINGFTPKSTQNKTSKIDEYYIINSLLLSTQSKQIFYYKRVLWQYLTDNHGLECWQSAFRAFINTKTEFNAYFKDGKKTNPVQSSIPFETAPGEQAQLEGKESIEYERKDGEIIYVNVAE